MTACFDPDPSVVERAQTPATHHSQGSLPSPLHSPLSLLSGWMGRSVDAAPLRRVRGALEEPLIGSLQPAGKGRGDAPELSAVLKLRREPCLLTNHHFPSTYLPFQIDGSTFHFNIWELG